MISLGCVLRVRRGVSLGVFMPSTGSNQNIELKARIPKDLGTVYASLQYLQATLSAEVWQRDVYFFCAEEEGQVPRLKLRGESPDAREWDWSLIWYSRPNQRASRRSVYRIAQLGPVPDPVALAETLAAAWGNYSQVDKRRQVFWYQNVRIHVDEVVSLGRFVEFEAVVANEGEERAAHEMLKRLKDLFQIQDSDLIDVSYGDAMKTWNDLNRTS